MNRIGRYIFRQVFWATALVIAGLVCVLWLTQSLKMIEMIVNRGLPISMYLTMTVLVLPKFLGVILPIALFTAVLFTYNKLGVDSELVALRASGVSETRLAAPALALAAIVTVLGYGVSLYVMPASYRAFSDLRQVVRNTYAEVVLEEGVFNAMSEGVTVYVRGRSPNGELLGILVHDERDPARPVTMMAQRGALIAGADGPRVLMIQGTRQQVSNTGGALSLLYFDRYLFEIGQTGTPGGVRWREAHERYLHELFTPADQAGQAQFLRRLRVEGHHRLSAPLLALSFAMIGLACLLCGQFSRRGQASRILVAAVLVVVVEIVALSLKNLAEKTPELILLFYVNASLPIAVGGYFLIGRRRWRPAPLIAARAG